jgi:hypothetical protein
MLQEDDGIKVYLRNNDYRKEKNSLVRGCFCLMFWCAQDEIRTRTTLRMPPPQDGASTNFATWAF